METHPLIEKAIRAAGRQSDLAAAMGVAQQTVSKLLNREINVNAEHAVLIEHATAGAVTARELRPDLPWPVAVPATESAAAI